MRLKFNNETPAPTVHKCGHPLDPKKSRPCEACGQQIHAKGGFRSAKKSCLACSAENLAKDKADVTRRLEEKKAQLASERAAAEAGVYRLPDGARFDVSYDASTTTWSGTLTIGPKVFTAKHQAVFKLLRKLDRLARTELELPVWSQQLAKIDRLPEDGEVV